MNQSLLERVKSSLLRKIYLIIGRGILVAVNNDGSKVQKIQIKALNRETITDIERLQNYGLESYPDSREDFEVLTGFIGGNRNQGVTFVVHRRERPTISNGEVSLYSKYGKNILLDKNNRIILADGTTPAARKNDAIQATFADDPKFFGWVANISAVVNGIAPGSVPVVPDSMDGKIIEGTDTVHLP